MPLFERAWVQGLNEDSPAFFLTIAMGWTQIMADVPTDKVRRIWRIQMIESAGLAGGTFEVAVGDPGLPTRRFVIFHTMAANEIRDFPISGPVVERPYITIRPQTSFGVPPLTQEYQLYARVTGVGQTVNMFISQYDLRG